MTDECLASITLAEICPNYIDIAGGRGTPTNPIPKQLIVPAEKVVLLVLLPTFIADMNINVLVSCNVWCNGMYRIFPA